MLVTVNNRLKFEIEIVHDLSCHPCVLTGCHKSPLHVWRLVILCEYLDIPQDVLPYIFPDKCPTHFHPADIFISQSQAKNVFDEGTGSGFYALQIT